ncbi:diguanylate cyclase, partial [Myxococcota bacterium]|nr:diguanylate cyclase [Myxococcota bacterium]
LHNAGHASEAEENSWKTLTLYSQNLSSEDYFNASSDLSYNLFLRGYTRQSYEVMLRVFDRYGDSAGRGTSSLEQIFSHYLSAAEYILGMNTRAFERIEHALVELVSADTERFFIGDITAYLSIFAAESGDERLKIEDIQDARQSLEQTPSRTIYYQRHYYVFESWYWVRQLEKSQGGAEAASLLSHLRKSLHLLGQVLSTDVMRSHYLILLAWAEVYSGALNKGTRISEKACHMATRADNRWVLYEVALLRSVVARELYSEASAQTHAAMAHGIAVQQGWFNRQIKLEEEFDSLVKNRAFSRTPKRANETLSESSQAASELQRNLDAMMEASLTLAKPDSAVVQARRVLDIVLRLLGAERGAFLVPDGNSYFEVRACYDFESYKAATSTFAFDRALVEQVLDQRESQVVLAASPESAVNLKSGGGPRNIAAVPVERGQHLLGVVYIERRASDGTFSASDLQVLKAFASFLAVAIEAADVSDLEADFEAERTRRRVAEELSILSRDLVAARSARDIAAILARHLPHTMGTHNVAALVFREDGIERIAQTGIFSDIDPPDDLLGSLSMLERKKLENSSHITWEWHEGMRGMPYWLQKCLNVWDRGAVMALPIASRKHVLGVVFLANKDEESFGSSLSGFAEAIVHQTSGAVQGIRLMEEIARLAATDDLTGVSNRRHFFMLGEREIARAQRHNSTLTALMVDVDHFKAINDEHGHLVGDVVLKEIAKRMSDNLRTIDVIGRYGGEEFAILLPDANLDVAKKVIAEELRLAVCAQPIDGGSASVTVTISVGVAELDDQTSSLEALIGRADMAMYQAKERGRNRIVTEKEI